MKQIDKTVEQLAEEFENLPNKTFANLLDEFGLGASDLRLGYIAGARAREPEIAALRMEIAEEVARSKAWEKVAIEWMNDYDKLKNKYEPMYVVASVKGTAPKKE